MFQSVSVQYRKMIDWLFCVTFKGGLTKHSWSQGMDYTLQFYVDVITYPFPHPNVNYVLMNWNTNAIYQPSTQNVQSVNVHPPPNILKWKIEYIDNIFGAFTIKFDCNVMSHL